MDSRRELIKKIGLGAIWTTPVVQSVILPAHAQTSSTGSTTPVATPVTYKIDSASIELKHVGNGQSQRNSFQVTVSASDGSSLEGYFVSIRVTFQGNNVVINMGSPNVDSTNMVDVATPAQFIGQGTLPSDTADILFELRDATDYSTILATLSIEQLVCSDGGVDINGPLPQVC